MVNKQWNDLWKAQDQLKRDQASLKRDQASLDREERELKVKERQADSQDEKLKLDKEKAEYQKKRDEVRDKQERLRNLQQQLKNAEDKLERAQKQEKEDKEKAQKQAREDKEKKEQARKDKEKAAKNAQVNVRVTDNRSISMEPTTMEIDRVDKEGNKSRMFLGVKVVPMRVSSDVKLSHLILFDANLSSLSAMMISLGRKLLKGFYTILDRWLRRLRQPIPTGDPRHDILMGRTGMGRDSETFIVLSKQEDIDEFFLDNIAKMNRLFKMGWGNIVIADDIARVAYFCTGELRGMCSGVPYAMMYQNLGQAKAYETMEDAKKANSSIFKISKQFTRVLGECKHDLKLLTYTQLNEDNKNE